ncbi:MAG: tetratricopeptide repeat protein [Terriglobia bacterium]
MNVIGMRVIVLFALLSYSPPPYLITSILAQSSEGTLESQIAHYIQIGQFDRALQDARLGVSRYPLSSQMYQLLGISLFKKELNDEARAAFRRAIELDSSNRLNFYNLALVDLSLNEYSEAAASLETLLRDNPRDAPAHVLLGRVYHNLNRPLAGIQEFRTALSIWPNLPLAHYHLGYGLLSLGYLKEALEEFRKEIDLNADFYGAYWLAGNIELDRDNVDVAEPLLRRSAELKPEAFEPHYGLGRVLVSRRQWPEAEAEFKRALAANPGSARCHYALARLYQQMGRKEDAEREFRVVADLHARIQHQLSGIADRRE